METKLTTLCYMERGGEYLMLHRTKKKNDENRDKWIGVGGKFEPGESPEDCLRREVREETGLTLTRWRYRGLVTFVSDVWPCEYMHLFTADASRSSWLNTDAMYIMARPMGLEVSKLSRMDTKSMPNRPSSSIRLEKSLMLRLMRSRR